LNGVSLCYIMNSLKLIWLKRCKKKKTTVYVLYVVFYCLWFILKCFLKKKKKKKNYMLKVFFAASKSNSTKRLPKNQYSYHAILMTDVLSLGHTKSEFRHYPWSYFLKYLIYNFESKESFSRNWNHDGFCLSIPSFFLLKKMYLCAKLSEPNIYSTRLQ